MGTKEKRNCSYGVLFFCMVMFHGKAVNFMKTDKYHRDGGYMENSGFTGNTQQQERDYAIVVLSSLIGTYYLCVSN